MASAFDSLIKGLSKSSTSAASGPALPSWIKPGASVQYESASAGKALPAIVEHISPSKQLIVLKFPHAKGTKNVTFSQVNGSANPLKPGGPGAASANEREDPDKFLDGIDKKWADKIGDKAAPSKEQGPQLMPDWARKFERERVEDLTAEKVHDIDSSPEPEVSNAKKNQDKATEDIDNPYAIGTDIDAKVAAEEHAARTKKRRAASSSRSLSAGSAASKEQGKPEKQKKAKAASPKERSRSPAPTKKKRDKSALRSPPAKKKRSLSRKTADTKKRARSSSRKKRRSRSAETTHQARRKKASRSRSRQPASKGHQKASPSPEPEPSRSKRRKVSRSVSRRRAGSRSPRRKSSRSLKKKR